MAALQAQGSVQDVEWGDDASDDGSEVESEKSAASAAGDDDAKDFKPAGLSSIAEIDVAPAKSSADKASFESWMSKGEGEDFGEGDSAEGKEEPEAAPEDTVDKKAEEPRDGEGVEADPAELPKAAEESAPAAADGEESEQLVPDVSVLLGTSCPFEEGAGSASVTLHVEGRDDGAEPTEGVAPGEDDLPPGDDLPPADDGPPLGEKPTHSDETSSSAKSESGKKRRCYHKVWKEFKRRQRRFASAFARVRDRHTIKVRIVLIPVFILMSPIFLLIILYKAAGYCLYQLCRNQEKEAEEAQRKAAGEEAARVAASIAAGPQRSKLKQPVSAMRAQDRFQRKRNLQKGGADGDDEPHEESFHHKHGGRMNLHDAAQQLKGDQRKKRFAEQREIDMIALGKRRPKDPLWKRSLPTRWPRLTRDWWKARNIYFKRVAAVIDTIEEEEEFDWENLDENGSPAQNKFFFPKTFRRKYRFFILVYLDPLIELLDNWPLFVKGIRWFIRLMPLFAMLGAFGWFGYMLWRNLQFVSGECIVERLPLMFETTGKIDEMVTAGYIVRREFAESPTRPAGSIIQDCIAIVPCSKMDYGATNAYDDDRCVVFQAWKLGDKIPCYYEQDDFWGDKGTDLSCLSLPSKMERETFTVAIAVVLNVLICLILGIYKWHKSDMRKQADLASTEQLAAEEEEAKAKKLIEEKEAEEALAQAEAVNRELGIGEEGDEEAMGDMAAFMAAKDDEDQDQDR